MSKTFTIVLAAACLAMATMPAPAADDAFTPLVATPFGPPATPVPGTDGRWHFVYELQLANTRAAPATLRRLRVTDASPAASRTAPLAELGPEALATRLHGLDNRTAPAEIELNASRLLLIDFALAPGDLPERLGHVLELTGQATNVTLTEPVAQSYAGPTMDVLRRLPVLRPPLVGRGWVAFNGCCDPGPHRGTALPVNGRLHLAQRFAIDWMRLDDQGRLWNGDPAEVRSYTSYGAELLAVADGVVVSAEDGLPDQAPPSLPDPATITLANVDGNHVVLDIGNGLFAFYAHMQPRSVKVEVGQRVRAGEALGLLGNSGNSSAPHLHFHLMDGASVLGSEGLPYALDRFALAGKIPEADMPDDLGGDFHRFLMASPEPRSVQFPLDMDVVDFGP